MKNKKIFSIFLSFLLAGLLIFTACYEIIDDKNSFDPYNNGAYPPDDYSPPIYTKANTITISGLSLSESSIGIGLFQNEDQVNPDFVDTRPEIYGSNYIQEQSDILKTDLYYSSNKNWDGGGLWYVVFVVENYDYENQVRNIQNFISKSPVDFTSNKDQKIDFSEFKEYVFRTTAGSIAELKSFNISASGITLDELLLNFNCMNYAQMLANEKITELYKNEEKTQLFNGGDRLYSNTKIYGEVDIMPLLKNDGAHITGIITLTDVPDNFLEASIYLKNGNEYQISSDVIQDSDNFLKLRWSIAVYDSYPEIIASDYNFYLNVNLNDNSSACNYTVPIQTAKYISNKNAYVGDLGTVSLKSIVVSGNVYALVNNQLASLIEVVVKTPQGLTNKVEAYIPNYHPSLPESYRSSPSWSVRLPVFASPAQLSFDVIVRDRTFYQLLYTRELSNPIVFVSNEDVSGVNLYVSDKFVPVNVSPLTADTWIHDSIENIADVYWYSLEVTKGTSYYFWWNDKNQGDGSKTAIINIRAYTSSAYNSSDGEVDLYRSGGWNSSAVYTAGSSGTVFIKVTVPKFTGTYAIVYSTNDSKPAGGNTTYTVSFNSNGGNGTVSPSSITMLSESEITLPLAGSLSKDGYAFGGWNTLANGAGVNYVPGASYTITGNVTLYAKWNLAYTITFNGNGADGTVPSYLLATASTNHVVPLPSSGDLSKNGYTFGGWNTNSSGTGTNYNTGANYTAGGNVTLYAKWNPIYTITFNINGGSGEVPSAIQAKKDTDYVISLPSGSGLSNGNSIFGGWNTNSSGTGTNYYGNYTANGSITLYAKWNPPGSEGNPLLLTEDTWMDGNITSASIWYYFNITNETTYNIWWNDKDQGDNTKTSNIDVSGHIYGSSAAITVFSFVDSAWISPKSYISDSEGIIKLQVRPYNTGTFAIVYSTKNSKPAKTGNTYTIAFNGNGGAGTVSTITEVSGGVVPLPNGSGFTKYAYSFAGWNTKSDGSGTNYSVGDFFTVDEYVTLYAKWDPIPLSREGNPIPLIENLWKNDEITSSTVDREIWYCFDAVSGKTYYLWWNDSAVGDGSKTLDVKIDLYNTNGLLASSADNGWNQSQSITANSNGKIKIKVYPKNSSSVGTFALVHSTKSGKPEHTLLTENKWTYGYIPASSEEQWFKFTATAATQYIHFIFGSLTNINIQLYDNDYNMVENKSNLSGNNKSFSSTLNKGQEYFIKVTPYSNSGTYKIAFNLLSFAPSVNVSGNAAALIHNFWSPGNITTPNSEQWFKFTATADTQYINLKVDSGTIKNVFVQLYDNNGNAVGNWEYITGNISFDRSLYKGSVYYLQVMPTKILIPSNSDKGSYEITFNKIKGFPTIIELPLNVLYTSGYFNTPESEVWFKFTAKAASHYFPVRITTTNNPPLSKLDYQLCNENGSPLESVTSLSVNEKNSGFIERSLTVGKTYYLKTSPSLGATGNSRFSITYNASSDAVIRPSYMPAIFFNEWSQGEIKGESKEQWFSYSPTSNALFTFHFIPLTGGLYAHVYDESGATVYQPPEIITALTPSFLFILSSGNTYYIRITPSILSNAGKFSICVNTFVLAPLPPAN